MHPVQEWQIDGTVEYTGRIVAAEKSVGGHLEKGAKRFRADDIPGSQDEFRVHRDCSALCDGERMACIGPNFQVTHRGEPLVRADQDFDVVCAFMGWYRPWPRLLLHVTLLRAHRLLPNRLYLSIDFPRRSSPRIPFHPLLAI